MNNYTLDWDSVKPLLEELKPKQGEEALLEEVLTLAKAKFSIGDMVEVKGTSYIGRVHGFNERLGGFYPGVRYPVLVRIIHNDDNSARFNYVDGCVFEYDHKQLEHCQVKYYQVDAGTRSLYERLCFPLAKLFTIAELADQKVIKGHSYGDDYLFVPRNNTKAKAIEELLTENKLIWKIVDSLPEYLTNKD